MKKIAKLIVLLTISFLGLTNVSAKNTLGDLRAELQAQINKKKANEAAKDQTQSQINANNTAITNAHSEVEKTENDIELAKAKIKESNDSIDKLKDETSKLLVFYQLTMNDDSLTSYISSATSVTDLIMRSEAISQVLDYNQDKLKGLEQLILDNQQLQVDLAKKQEELKQKIVVYQDSVKSLEADLSALVEVTVDIDDEISAMQSRIKFLETIGCKEDEDIDVCLQMQSNKGWLKPTSSGYISSGFGWRSFILNGAPYSDFHPGVDVANAGAKAPVYSVANGTVAGIVYRSSCGGNQVFVHYIVQGQRYTVQYAHLYSINVSVGQNVTNQTIIGTVGGGGDSIVAGGGWDSCSTGWHLHFGVAKGYYLAGGCSDCYSNFNTFVASSIEPPFMPKFGQAYYSRY